MRWFYQSETGRARAGAHDPTVLVLLVLGSWVGQRPTGVSIGPGQRQATRPASTCLAACRIRYRLNCVLSNPPEHGPRYRIQNTNRPRREFESRSASPIQPRIGGHIARRCASQPRRTVRRAWRPHTSPTPGPRLPRVTPLARFNCRDAAGRRRWGSNSVPAVLDPSGQRHAGVGHVGLGPVTTRPSLPSPVPKAASWSGPSTVQSGLA